MRRTSGFLLIVSLLTPSVLVARAVAAEAPVVRNPLVSMRLGDLRPTQPVLGRDEIFFKLARWKNDPRKKFDDVCEDNGQGGVASFSANSDLRDPTSYTCRDAAGAHEEKTKSIVLAPDGHAYLVNGHHSAALMWAGSNGDADVRLTVEVEADFRALATMDEFWRRMATENRAWLFNARDSAVAPNALPSLPDPGQFQDDVFRSLVYFARDIAWEKPERGVNRQTGQARPAVDFVEFLWAREARKTVNPAQFDFRTVDGYLKALDAVITAIANAPADNVAGSGRTAEELGRRQAPLEKMREKNQRVNAPKIALLFQFNAR